LATLPPQARERIANLLRVTPFQDFDRLLTGAQVFILRWFAMQRSIVLRPQSAVLDWSDLSS
jgi:hypothetical protein